MLPLKNIRLWLTTIGVFLIMGSFISYLQADKDKAFQASSFTQNQTIKTIQVELKPTGMTRTMLRDVDHQIDRIAIVHAASYEGMTITPLKKALISGGYNQLLKADSRNAVVGTYVFAREEAFPFYEFVLKPLLEATFPHTSEDVGFYNLSDYASFVAERQIQNTPLVGTDEYVFSPQTPVLYQNHTSLAGVADIVIVIGNRGQ